MQETKGCTMGGNMAETFAATLSLEALKVFLSLAASQAGVPRDKQKVLRIRFYYLEGALPLRSAARDTHGPSS